MLSPVRSHGMTTFLSKEVQKGLLEARAQQKRRKARYRVQFDGSMYPVLKLWTTGFSVDAENAPHMRGLVDIFEGPKHVSQCLIVASDEENGEVKFEFKRSTPTSDKAALDFVRSPDSPVALLN